MYTPAGNMLAKSLVAPASNGRYGNWVRIDYGGPAISALQRLRRR